MPRINRLSRKRSSPLGCCDGDRHQRLGGGVIGCLAAGKDGLHRPEIATITDHSFKDVGTILDSHYLDRDSALGEAAIRKLEGESPN